MLLIWIIKMKKSTFVLELFSFFPPLPLKKISILMLFFFFFLSVGVLAMILHETPTGDRDQGHASQMTSTLRKDQWSSTFKLPNAIWHRSGFNFTTSDPCLNTAIWFNLVQSTQRKRQTSNICQRKPLATFSKARNFFFERAARGRVRGDVCGDRRVDLWHCVGRDWWTGWWMNGGRRGPSQSWGRN